VLPPLRERRADIPLLAEYFLAKLAKSLGKKRKVLTAKAMAFLVNYDWPGNVRELQNMLERAVHLTTAQIIDKDDLDFAGYNHLDLPPMEEEKTLKEITEQLEQKVIANALNKYGTIRKAAKALGISHSGLIKKLKKYGN